MVKRVKQNWKTDNWYTHKYLFCHL